ncbi:hypothetical protein NDU88_000408 [Pleurodeles waltl]|uniref:Uncharacterized protein n=1 Tax=Pleurodeles waltl TaxID=8319 RepID=A0AAV7WFG0_PLEWA|nr:hypothetical protein NDU88_000408 [Pleurodeles waltl]
MGALRRDCEGLVGGPSISFGLCWFRASVELGRSRQAAARLPFWVKLGRVSTDADRLLNGETEAAGLVKVASSSRIRLFSSISALQKKVRDSGREETEETPHGHGTAESGSYEAPYPSCKAKFATG